MDNKYLIGAAYVCLGMISLNVNAALLERLGGLAYYDTEADLTWLADANAAAGSVFDDGTSASDGYMSWENANAWAASLDVAGVTGWRLPDTIDVNNDGATYSSYYKGVGNIYLGVDAGYNISDHSDLSNMFFNVLGNRSIFNTDGSRTAGCPDFCLTNTGPFGNIQFDFYWSATEYPPDHLESWGFNMALGSQYGILKTISAPAWAVHAGDVSVVPVPAALWLFGSGFLGLIGFGIRNNAD